MKRFILTGTAGAGKTTILQALDQLGHSVIAEAATDIIAEQQAAGISNPWESIEIVDHFVTRQRERQVNAQGELQFYDRSPVCTYAFCNHMGYTPTKLLLDEIQRMKDESLYEPQVLFIENLGYVEKTAARKISYEDALRFEKLHLNAYELHGYECFRIPAASVDERVQSVLEIVNRLA